MDKYLRFLRFGLVGLFCAAVYFGVLEISVKYWDFPVFWGSAAAFAAGIPVSYFGNRLITYKSTNKAPREFARFLTAQLINLVVTSSAVAFASHHFGLPLYMGAFLSFVLAPCVTFLMFEIWVYNPRNSSANKNVK